MISRRNCPNRNTSFFEPLENRTLMSVGSASGTFVYLESNDTYKGKNAVLAYTENAKTGALTPLPNSQYFTDGTGERNAGAKLGPDDSDKEVIASPDGNYLYAVNQGSDTIAAFAIHSDGSLTLVGNKSVSSGGVQPISLAFSNDRLYVLNRGNSADGTVGTAPPSLTVFNVGEDGRISPIPHSTITLPLNLSSAQLLISADGKFAFVDNFATPANLKVSLANTIEPFTINADGTLTAVAHGAASLPANPPLVLGLVEDPIHHILYTGLAPTGGIATFTYDSTTGAVKYAGQIGSLGKATCWLQISPNGKYLYGTDSGSDELSVYSLANPLKPVQIQEFQLKGPLTGPYDKTATGPTTGDFQFSFDPSGKFIWVVNHTLDDGFQPGNQLHTLDVASNGTLSEPSGSPLFFPRSIVPGLAKIDGLAVVTPAGYYAGYASTAIAQTYAKPAAQFTGVFSDDHSKVKSLAQQLLG